ncbi:NAD(P)H-dependent oxidoreductase [Granulicatella seriolae]|uniref:NAD(P)H-dependent oxidoreductase n=1 Tax=Granulicatella seriolae TaxID=2967226 RepID=A0ABT1WNW4_9LACT|nr:NAD(P)H-dependent oxidoreductase [Granulicatella seriolae]
MKALIVFAHPRKVSFTHSLVKRIHQSLEKKGYEVTVRDLYDLNFDPVLREDDVVFVEDGKFTRKHKEFPADVQVEQQHILDNDLLVYVFPSWWNGMPAIFKGYIDRVFQHGFAYSFEDPTIRDKFTNKRVIYFTPTGQPQNEDGSDTPINAAMRTLISNWLFNGNGAQLIDHVFYGRVPYKSTEELEAYLDDAEKRIMEL